MKFKYINILTLCQLLSLEMQNNVKPKFINAYTHHKTYALRHLCMMLMCKLIRFIWVENIEKKEVEHIQFLFKICSVICLFHDHEFWDDQTRTKHVHMCIFGSKHVVLQNNIFSNSWSTSQENQKYKFRYPLFFYQQHWAPPNPLKICITKVLTLN
jgi:hypothetical protein